MRTPGGHLGGSSPQCPAVPLAVSRSHYAGDSVSMVSCRVRKLLQNSWDASQQLKVGEVRLSAPVGERFLCCSELVAVNTAVRERWLLQDGFFRKTESQGENDSREQNIKNCKL